MIRISFSFLYIMTIQDDDNKSGEAVYPVPSRLLAGGSCPTPHVVGMDQYKKMWEESVNDPDTFFSKASIYYFVILHGGLIICILVGTRLVDMVQALHQGA